MQRAHHQTRSSLDALELMSSQKSTPSLQDLLVSSWRHDQARAHDYSHYPSLPPRVLCHSDSIAGFTAQRDNQSKLRHQLLENCEQYVLNYLPTHLLRISDMELVTRTEFWEAERSRVENTLHEDVRMFTQVKRRNSTGNSSRDNWHLRTRGDEITDIHQDAVRDRSTTLLTNLLFHFSSTSAACSSSLYSHTVGEMMSLCFAT